MSSQVTSSKHLLDAISPHEHALVYFYKTWCPYCTAMSPVFERAATEKAGAFKDLHFYKVNLEEQKDIEQEMNIKGFPQTLLFIGGQEIARFGGVKELAEFEKWLNSSVASGSAPENIATTSNEYGDTECSASNESNDELLCTGVFKERRKRPSILLRGNKPFPDLEPNCVIKPTPEINGAQIGRANEGLSYFAISLWNSPDESPGKIFFGLDFMPDPVEKDRFESAMFQVTFGHDDVDKKHLPLNILELEPTSAEDLTSRAFFDGGDQPSGMSAEPGENASIYSTSTENLSGRRTDTVIRGQGVHSPTATWNFVEHEGQGIRRGLDAHYALSVVLPTTSRVWMKFYGKAVLVNGDKIGLGLRRRVTLKSGSMDAPYERILDLSVALERGR